MGTLISLDGIHSVWPCSEATGQSRLDTFSLNDMADVNSCQQVDGLIGTEKASQATIANQRFLRLNDTVNILSGDFNFCTLGWGKVNARETQNQYLIGKSKAGTEIEWYLWYRGAVDKKLRFTVSSTGAGGGIVSLSAPTVVTIGVPFWWFVAHDADTNKLICGIDNVYAELAHSAGIYNGGNATGTGPPFNIHSIANSPVTLGSDSTMQHINYVKRVWTPAERTLVFTNQAIYPYPAGSKIIDVPLFNPLRAAVNAAIS